MANAEIKAVITAEDRASATLANFGRKAGGIGNTVKKGLKLAAVGIAAAGAAAIAFGVSSVKSYQESENALAQLNAVLKSTRGIAKVSAKSAISLANSLQKVTRYSDEQVLSAENMLLTFTKISKDVFPDTTKAVLDMSTAMGTDLKSTAIQVGKAMQDPVRGVTALQRVGVRLSDSQKELVKNLVATGKTAEAQKIILKELQTEFGGSAEAAGKTFSGRLEILKNQFDEIKEAIGGVIVDALTPLMASLANFVASDQFQAWLTNLTNWLKINLPLAIAWLKDEGIPFLINAFKSLWPILTAGITVISSVVGWLAEHKRVLQLVIGALIGWKLAMGITKTVQLFSSALSTMGINLTSFGGKLGRFGGWAAFATAAVVAFAIVKDEMDKLKAKTETTFNSISSDSNHAVKQMEKLNKKWKAGEISDAEYQRGLARINKATNSAVQRANAELDNLGNTWQGKFYTGLKNWAKSTVNGALPMLSRKASGTNFFTPRKYATGTSASASGMALVGERGPEMVTLPRGSKVSRADETRKMMGGVTNINITVPMMTGSANERRKVARMLIKDIQDIAQMNGKSVTDMMSSNYGLVT